MPSIPASMRSEEIQWTIDAVVGGPGLAITQRRLQMVIDEHLEGAWTVTVDWVPPKREGQGWKRLWLIEDQHGHIMARGTSKDPILAFLRPMVLHLASNCIAAVGGE